MFFVRRFLMWNTEKRCVENQTWKKKDDRCGNTLSVCNCKGAFGVDAQKHKPKAVKGKESRRRRSENRSWTRNWSSLLAPASKNLKRKKKEGCQSLNLQQSADIDSTQRCNTVALLYSLLQLAPPHEATCGAKGKLEYYIFDAISTPSAGSITAWAWAAAHWKKKKSTTVHCEGPAGWST